jgi:hypothetical protein
LCSSHVSPLGLMYNTESFFTLFFPRL